MIARRLILKRLDMICRQGIADLRKLRDRGRRAEHARDVDRLVKPCAFVRFWCGDKD